jgi:hypothetical protein
MPPLPKPKSLSFYELMTNVGRGHSMIAQQPGAQAIPSAARTIRPGETPQDVLARYQREGRFVGSTGDPLTYQLMPTGNPSGQAGDVRRISRGELPREGVLSFTNPRTKAEEGRIYMQGFDESELLRPTRGRTPDESQISMLRKLPKNSEGERIALNLDTMRMPGGMGRAGYAAMLDAMIAGGYLNYLDNLTKVNLMRRPGNVMSSGIAHGHYDNVPLFEGRDYDPRPFDPITTGTVDARASERALESVLSGHPLDTAKDLDAMGVSRFGDDAKTGALATKEMQVVKAFTLPDYDFLGAVPGEQRLMDVAHPMDSDLLKEYVARTRGSEVSNIGSRGIRSGFGTGIVGRSGTTEALLRGLQEGKTTEEIVEELLGYPGADEALKGRYKLGGLAHAAIED